MACALAAVSDHRSAGVIARSCGVWMFRFLRRARGFSLIEIAIVLVIVGIMISAGVGGVSAVKSRGAVQTTVERQTKIQTALLAYVIQYGCLPCPAVVGGAGGGQAVDNLSTAYATSCGTTGGGRTGCSVTQGIVPWVNLGLNKDDVIDGFGTLIEFAPTPALTTTSTQMVYRTTPTGTLYPNAGTLTVNDAAADQQTNVAAYVLVSHGPDRSYGYLPGASGTASRLPDPHGSALQGCNADASVAPNPACGTAGYVLDDPRDGAAASWFDDIVRFETARIMIQKCGAGSCANPQ